MKTLMIRLAVSALIGVSGLTALAGGASAETFGFGIRSGPLVDIQYRDERDWSRDRHHGWDDRRPDWNRERRGGRCAPWLAADKARDYGLRRARVVDVTPRRVVVEGRRHGDFRTVVFANMRGCPVIGR